MTDISRTLIDREHQVVAHNYHPLPIVVASASGCHVRDVEGREYLDFMSAYSAVSHGHLHPRIVQAATDQLKRVALASRAYHADGLAPLAEKLCALSGLDRMLPMNTGAEAVETAIKAARRWGYRVKGIAQDRAQILVARGNFHGRTSGITSFSTQPEYRADFGPFMPGFIHFDFGNMASIEAAVTPDCAAVLVEPIQGEAGIVVPPSGYLRALREFCDRQHLMLILDEVQSGLGRTGRWFAYQHEGIRPDGLILGKALGGGLLPVSCLLGRAELMDVFEPGSHGSTFGGNALACAVARAAIDVLEDEWLIERSQHLGDYLLARLRAIDSPLITEVRGLGLWAGVEICPGNVTARRLVERLAQHGVLSKETHHTVIRFAPPLTVSRDEIDEALGAFETTLAEFSPLRRRAIASAPAQLLMSAPDHFEVSYAINPWMNPAQWAQQASALTRNARRGWDTLKQTYESLGAQVHVQTPAKGLPDLVFTANAGVVLDHKVLLARFRPLERQGEEAHNRRVFETLQQQGVIDSIHLMPHGVFFEGAGDALWDAQRGFFWLGYGPRSSYEARDTLQAVFGQPSLSLELVDPRFYHLDTCLCLLSGGEVLYYPKAFSQEGRALIQALAGDQAIEADDIDALHLGVNSVCLGKDVVMGYCSPGLEARLQARGYRVHRVDLTPFNQSGGSSYCLTLRLDRVSGTQHDVRHYSGQVRLSDQVDQRTGVIEVAHHSVDIE